MLSDLCCQFGTKLNLITKFSFSLIMIYRSHVMYKKYKHKILYADYILLVR